MNKTAKFGSQQAPKDQNQETDPIRKRFELYDSLFSKFEEKISKIEGVIKKKPQLSQTISSSSKASPQINTTFDERSPTNSNQSNVNISQCFKKFEDKMLDQKIQFEKKHLSQEEKFKAIMNRLEKYEAVQEKIDQNIKSIEMNSNNMIQNINCVDERLNKLEQHIKVMKMSGQLSNGGQGGAYHKQMGVNLTEEVAAEINSLYTMVKKCNSNFNNLHTQINQIKRQIESSPSSQTNGNTPKQNKRKSRIGGVDENEKPLPTFQDTNRKFFVDQSSSKKLGEKLMQQEESVDKHLISYTNSPNFASSNASPLNQKCPNQKIQINKQQSSILQQNNNFSQQQQQQQQQQQKQQQLQQKVNCEQRIAKQQQAENQQTGNKQCQRLSSNENEQLNNSNSINQSKYNIQLQQQGTGKQSQSKLYSINHSSSSSLNQAVNSSQLNNSSYISSIKKNLNEEFESKRSGRSNSMHENVLNGNMMRHIEIEAPSCQGKSSSIRYDYYFENNSTKSNRYSSTNISSQQALNTIVSQNDAQSPNLALKRYSLKPPISSFNQKYQDESQTNLSLCQEQMNPINPTSSSYTPSSNIDHINRSFALIEEKKRKIDEEIEKRIREESQKRDKIIGTIETKNRVYEQPNMHIMQEMNKFKHTPKGTQSSRTKEMLNRLSLERKVKDDKISQFEKQANGNKNQTYEF